MAALTPELLQTLRQQFPPFGGGVQSSSALQLFCEFYGVDFSTRLPSVEHVTGLVHSGEYTLAVHHWCQPDATANLLLVHGYFDHTGVFSKLIEWGLSCRYNVLIFDLPGHGLSSGESAVIDDFSDYSRAISDVLRAVSLPSLPLWTMAQSTGCAALVDYASKYPWPFAASVLLAPLIRPVRWKRVKAACLLLKNVVDSLPRKFSPNSSDRQFQRFLISDPLQSQRISLRWVSALRRWLSQLRCDDLGVGPALIVQGDADATVDWRYNVGVVRQLFPASHVEYLPGAGHHLANESDKIRSSYLRLVENWLSKSGIGQGGAQ
ncbi:MAG: alpha/beta hydrolase [Halioglobus sp.]|nr:alpha/beta hydrolase [Halioglobus sp.]